jgi:hypothetical protein
MAVSGTRIAPTAPRPSVLRVERSWAVNLDHKSVATGIDAWRKQEYAKSASFFYLMWNIGTR